jgi:aryl-alcohol dehydrogenase-like predicted oxidoreductase
VVLGNTGIVVSRLCIGTNCPDVYESSLGREILIRGFDLGVNFWDSAEDYGSFSAIREALRVLDRNDVVITSKSYGKDRDKAEKDLEYTLHEIGTDYLDVFMLHFVYTLRQLEARKEVLEFLLEAKRKGLIRSVGVSTHSAEVTLALAEVPGVDVVLTILNIEGVDIMHGDLSLMHSAVNRLYEAGKGVCLMKALGKGKLVHRAEESLRYVFRIPYAHAVSVGIERLEELETAVKLEKETSEQQRIIKG